MDAGCCSSFQVPAVHVPEILKARLANPISVVIIGPGCVLNVCAFNVRNFLPAELAMIVISAWVGSSPFFQRPCVLVIEGGFLAKTQAPVIFFDCHWSGLDKPAERKQVALGCWLQILSSNEDTILDVKCLSAWLRLVCFCISPWREQYGWPMPHLSYLALCLQACQICKGLRPPGGGLIGAIPLRSIVPADAAPLTGFHLGAGRVFLE